MQVPPKGTFLEIESTRACELSPPIALRLHARRRLEDASRHLLGHNTKKFCREIYIKNIILQGNVGKYLSTIYLTK